MKYIEIAELLLVTITLSLLTQRSVNGQTESNLDFGAEEKTYRKVTDDDQHVISYPQSVESRGNDIRKKRHKDEDNMVIPFDLLDEINSLSNISEFFDKYVNKDSIDPRDAVVPRSGEDVERAREVNAMHAGCKPENEVVPLTPNKTFSSGTIIFPSCTRVKRCSGCCLRPDVLSCQPTEIELIPFKVTVTEYGGGSEFNYVGKEIILVEEHRKCKCACKKKEEDCNLRQRYDAPKCKCVCTNVDDEQKCLRSPGKTWDDQECVCRCIEPQDCVTGEFFNENLCTCVQAFSVNRHYPVPISNRSLYFLKPIPVSEERKYRTD